MPVNTVRYLKGPIIGYGGWANDIPNWLRQAIGQARVEQVAQEQVDGKRGDRATEEEVCAYLYGASLSVPFNRDWAEIYQYVFARVLNRRTEPTTGQNLWQLLDKEPINNLQRHQQQELDKLLRWLRKQTIRNAKDKEIR